MLGTRIKCNPAIKTEYDRDILREALNSLEAKGYVRRYRSTEDERVLFVEATEAGEALRDKALPIPAEMSSHVVLDREESLTLYRLLNKLLTAVEKG